MTAKATLTPQNTRLQIAGEIHFDNAGAVYQQGVAWLKSQPESASVVIDLLALQSANTMTLAVLMQWLRQADRASQRLHCEHIPQQLQAIMLASNVQTCFSKIKAAKSVVLSIGAAPDLRAETSKASCLLQMCKRW